METMYVATRMAEKRLIPRRGGDNRGLPGRIGLSSRQSAITVALCLLT